MKRGQFSDAALRESSRPSVTGTLQLAIDDGTVMLELDFADGWTCLGNASAVAQGSLSGSCTAPDGTSVVVTFTDLQQRGDGAIIGSLEVIPTSS